MARDKEYFYMLLCHLYIFSSEDSVKGLDPQWLVFKLWL